MVLPTAEAQYYRPAAGIAVFNPQGKIWLGRRKGQTGPHIWQLPQGGIDIGEPAQEAAIRELYEETGIQANKIELLSRIDDELYYDFPKSFRTWRRTLKWRGQRQSWFAVRFKGKDADIDLKAHPPQEFSDWRWADLEEIPGLIIPFKRKVYERLVSEFAGFAKPVK